MQFDNLWYGTDLGVGSREVTERIGLYKDMLWLYKDMVWAVMVWLYKDMVWVISWFGCIRMWFGLCHGLAV